ncbi:MAG: hypothetical protein OXU71_02380 [Gammaproteobacteria bacterium]|nr:hypothetical protein [Gammaproteobacteria bacterium]
MTYLDTLIDIATVLATVAIAFAALVGPSKAIKTFRSQKWWEMRAHAYGKIVEALYQVQDIHDKYIAQEINGKSISHEEKENLARELCSASEEVRKFAVIGKFLLPEQAANRLKIYHAEVEKEISKWRMSANDSVNYVNILESQWAAAKSCLEDIQEVAEGDLGVK